MNRIAALCLICLSLDFRAPAYAEDAQRLEYTFLNRLFARQIGPANMGGRVVDLAVVEGHPGTFYVASASGGLWKTSNNGTTFKPVFEHERTVSLGAVAVAPSNSDVVWVG